MQIMSSPSDRPALDSLAQRRLRERSFQEREPIDGGQPGVAQRPEPGVGRPEQPHQPVGDRLHGQHRFGPPPGKPFEQHRRARIGRGTAFGQDCGQRLDVAEPQVDALPGQRMDAMRGVADQRQPMARSSPEA